MATEVFLAPKWPVRLKELCLAVRSAKAAPNHDELVSELWLLLTASIAMYLRLHAGRYGRISREDLEDIASQKSLDLVQRIESGDWDVSDRLPSEIAGFVSAVARNGLLDCLREDRRRARPRGDGSQEPETDFLEPQPAAHPREMPDVKSESKEFALAVRECAGSLDRRTGLIWFFRVFLSMSSKEIAAHPEIRLKPSHVDVLLQRARQAIRDCMKKKGYEPREMPPGTFVEIWKVFRMP